MMTSAFDRELEKCQRIGPGRYRMESFGSTWKIGQVPNGGYSIAMALYCMTKELYDLYPQEPFVPRSLTAHYLTAVQADCPMLMEVMMVKKGRRVCHLSAKLCQTQTAYTKHSSSTPRHYQQKSASAVVCLSVLACFTSSYPSPQASKPSYSPPILPPIEQCISLNQHPPADSLMSR